MRKGSGRFWKTLFLGVLIGVLLFLAACRTGDMEETGKQAETAAQGTERLAQSGADASGQTASQPGQMASQPDQTMSQPDPTANGQDGPSGDAELTKEEQAAVQDFSLRFLKEAVAQAHAQGEENPVLSPVSAYMALLLTACGSDGVSRTEFEQLLGLPFDQWGQSGTHLDAFLNRTRETLRISSANSVWVDEAAQIREEYLRQVSEELHAEVYRGRLSSQEIMEAVNGWVSERTEGMIPTFLEEPYEVTIRLALLNALYLEARWKEPFLATATRPEVFHTAEGTEVSAEFLHDWMCNRDYICEEGVEGILLPYQEGSLAFMALRATDGRTPEELLAELTPESLAALLGAAESTLLDLSMPKFTLEYRQDLSETCRALGLFKTMTPGEADLSLMGTGAEGPLYVSDVRQAVKIQVDEEGTKAAAVTEVAPADGGAALEDPVTLCLDSPYLYMVVDMESGIPFFVGIMEQPPEAAQGGPE